MGKIRNTLQIFRRKLPKIDFIDQKHGNCANFDNGACIAAPRIFNLTNLHPHGPACPHFIARNG